VPSYDYRCNSCQRRVTLTYKTYKDYDAATPICPRCQSTDLKRIIGRVAVAKSDSSRLDNMTDDSMMDDLADADPATLGRYMRQMGQEVGEDLGDEFHEVVDRLERGESPDDIESSMPNLGADIGGSDDFGGSAGSDDF
jgi:putative FmdB family regulatory protein